jgi:hypothetical protein
MLPDARLIYIVRDPMDRAASALRAMIGGLEVPPERQRGMCERWLFQARGDYKTNIPLWDEAYGERVLYLPFGRIKTQPDELLRNVEDFLGLRHFNRYRRMDKQVHATKKIEIAPAAAEVLKEAAEPQYPFLRERFGEEFFAAIK